MIFLGLAGALPVFVDVVNNVVLDNIKWVMKYSINITNLSSIKRAWNITLVICSLED